jgi:hypothetical protein
MKIKGTVLAALSILGFSGVFAQSVEYDDMYFNSEDRAALKSQKGVELAYRTETKKKIADADEGNEAVNPTDSYSARNVNPEYTSRAQSQSAQSDEDDYFVNNYQYNRNQLNNWNNNYNNWYNNSWYRSNYYGPGISSWNSPYYGYNSWNSPWNDPYWSYNGWSSSFSYFYGPSWNYGWGGSYNYWNRPYYGWDPYGAASWYGGGYWNNYMYPGTIIVVNHNESSGRGVVYGKRPTRGTMMVSDRSSVRSRTNLDNSVRDNTSNSGRVSTSGRQADYYNKYNRSQRSSYGTADSRSNTERNRSWSNWNTNNSGYSSGSGNRTSSPSYSPSRSSSSMSTGSGTRTNSGSSSSGGRRGRD